MYKSFFFPLIWPHSQKWLHCSELILSWHLLVRVPLTICCRDSTTSNRHFFLNFNTHSCKISYLALWLFNVLQHTHNQHCTNIQFYNFIAADVFYLTKSTFQSNTLHQALMNWYHRLLVVYQHSKYIIACIEFFLYKMLLSTTTWAWSIY